MQLGMIGLGRMGANMVQRLLHGGHECVVFDREPASVSKLASDGAIATHSLDDFVATLKPPRAAWLMVPAAVDKTLYDLAALMQQGDIIIDGGNSHYIDDIRRVNELKPKGIHYVDAGTVAESGVQNAGTVL